MFFRNDMISLLLELFRFYLLQKQRKLESVDDISISNRNERI